MNGFGKKYLSGEKHKPPDMINYWNFFLMDETFTTTRTKYSWLDNCAFVGGNIDFVIIMVTGFFSLYNYKIAELHDYYHLHTS